MDIMRARKNIRNGYTKEKQIYRKASLIIPLVCLIIGVVFYSLFFGFRSGESTAFSPKMNQTGLTGTENIPEALPVVSEPVVPALTRVSSSIARGDTLTGILGTYLSPLEIHELAQACKPIFALTGIRTGQPYSIILKDDRLQGFEYEINNEQKLLISCVENGFDVHKQAIHYDVTPEVVAGAITASLSAALDHLHEGPELAAMMEDIFGWDINFARDIRTGDSFRLVVEKRFRNGKPAGYGSILAATFNIQNQRYQAYRFTDKAGRSSYYDQKGDSMRKAFLKAPLSFSRISSFYSNSRLHPILKIRKPHHGVDYAAPRGTPIKAVGDGVITARTFNKAAGRYIKIRHSKGYETIYNHMSRYAVGTQQGQRVVQGQTIGYVGMSGYATGPHLDFRVKKHGQYINPLHMKSPPTEPVSEADMPRFKQLVAGLKRQLGTDIPPGTIMEAGVQSVKHNG